MRFDNALIIALGVLFATPLVAQDPPPVEPATVASPGPSGALMPARVEGVAQVGDLARRQSELAVAKLDAEIAAVRGQAAAPAPAQGAPGAGAVQSPSAAGANLMVVAVHGTVDAPYAVVRAAGGTSIIREGSKLDDGGVVDNITTSRVTVRRQGRFVDLPFANGVSAGAPMGTVPSGAVGGGVAPGAMPASPTPLTPPIPSLFGSRPAQAVAPPSGQR
jgi:hypothetical protein